MIRKTLICVVAVLAGASTSAYHYGFFEQENVVTNAYQQMVGKFNDAGEVPATIDGSALVTQNGTGDDQPQGDSDTTSPVSPTTSAASRSSLEADSDRNRVESSAVSKTDNSDADSEEKSTSGTDSQTPSASSASSASSDAKKTGDSSQAAKRRKDEAKTAKEKQDALQDAKSLALLDVRFSKEIFKSPTGGELKYRKLNPRTGSIGEALPLIIFLHGSGERGDDNVSQLKHGLEYLASREGMQKFPATIIAPQCPKDQRWTETLAQRPSKGDLEAEPTEAMRMTMELIDSIKITDNIDSDRIYITGLSMGGFGTFDLIARRPSTFAAAVPLCGGGDTDSEIVKRYKDIPLWIIHGDEDPVVDVKYSRSVVEALKRTGVSPRYSELAGYGHNIWDAAYADTELYKWLFSQSKSGVSNDETANQGLVAKKSSSSKRFGSNNRTRSNAQTAQKSTGRSNDLQEAIQSDWRVLAATQRGRRADSATLQKMRVKFEGELMTIAIGDRSEAAEFRLPANGSGRFPWIDMISQREGVKDSAGILAMQGDKLVICWGMPGANRPVTFDSKEGVKTLVLQKK